MGAVFRFVGVVVMICAGMGAYNVFADAPQLESMARRQLCAVAPERPICRAGHVDRLRLTSVRRTPFSQTFAFAAGGRTVEAVCRRAYVLVGAYTCEPALP